MKNFKVGIQLYSVRDQMENDFYGTLKALKEAGYDYVEFAGYHDKSVTEIRAILDELGLECISSSIKCSTILNQGEAVVNELNTLGAKFCVLASASRGALANSFDSLIENFKAAADILAEGGIKLAYHNHDFEFQTVNGEYVLDRIYACSDGKFSGELDTCWVHYAGVDPAAYMLKQKENVSLIHLKDFDCVNLAPGPLYDLVDEDPETDRKQKKINRGFKYTVLGQGRQDIASILSAAEEIGIEYVIYERDSSHDQNSVEAAIQSRKYLKDTFGI
ncbi:MAG: sugar phosphate isomerase/epimerase [Ruminococcaceae bacterium]|nr:sugar phosphate isomerase/epimerase [Oscillospiraceae bacterium]